MSVPITQGTGASSVAAEIISGLNYQQIKIVGGQTGSTSTMGVYPDGSIPVSVIGTLSITGLQGASVSGTVGASVIGTVPTTQSGTRITSVSGTVNASVSGTAGASIIGTVPVVQSGIVITSIAGTAAVTITGSVLAYQAPLASLVSGVSSMITGTGQTSVLTTPPGGQRHYITNILVSNGAATATFVDVMNGPQIIYSGYAAASGGGFSATIPTGLRVPSADTSVDVKCSAQASVKAAMSGFTAA